jgi:hypothetical protein
MNRHVGRDKTARSQTSPRFLLAWSTLRFADRLLTLDATHFTAGGEPPFLPHNGQDTRLSNCLAEALQQAVLRLAWS